MYIIITKNSILNSIILDFSVDNPIILNYNEFRN
nr:MAG TPA: hypothetical protein [Caudoviricetes sp.]DAO69865.1 MAG TPA: hypothetical protein [Caudoviricetes sp.]